jgi:hypothetical protein
VGIYAGVGVTIAWLVVRRVRRRRGRKRAEG